MPSVENILAPYADKSYANILTKYRKLGLPEEKVEEVAWADVQRDMEQGFRDGNTSLTPLFQPR